MASSTGKTEDPRDYTYLSEVDAALQKRGHPWAFLLSLAVILFFLVFLFWASFAKMDETTRGMGAVIPSQGTQLIQNQEGGTIREMRVHETQVVEKGQLLARIQADDAEATLRDLNNKKYSYEAALVRLEAERENKETFEFPEDLRRNAPQAVTDQLYVFQTRKEQFDGEDRAMTAQLEQRKSQVEIAKGRKSSAERSLSLARQKLHSVEPLVKAGTYPRMEYLNLLQQVRTFEGDLAASAQNISAAESAVHEAEERLTNRESERQATFLAEITKVRIELNTVNEQIVSVTNRASRADLRAPMKGIIRRILVKQGGVARGGETIMELLPIEDTLEVEAKIKPGDIGFLHPGQKAMVKITAYDFSIYGGLEADLVQISADTVEDRRGDAYYLVRLRTRKNALVYRGRELSIIPGMTVSVDILTGEKTVLDLLLGPIVRAKGNAFRER